MYLLLVSQVVIFQACSLKTEPSDDETKTFRLADLFWLDGEWYRTSDDGVFTEKWVKLNDTVMEGETIVIEGADTLMTESILLTVLENNLLYIPSVSGESEGKPVAFACTSAKNDTWVFVNPTHDFPQFITYKKITPDSLVASISGVMNGKPKEILFPMKRKTITP